MSFEEELIKKGLFYRDERGLHPSYVDSIDWTLKIQSLDKDDDVSHLNDTIKNTSDFLTLAKEAFILEEMQPYIKEGALNQELKLRLQEKKDWKQQVNRVIEKIRDEMSLNNYSDAMTEHIETYLNLITNELELNE